jgi:hypothetical protein
MDRTHAVLARKAHIFGLLEAICQELDVTQAQYELATSRYGTVGAWLAGSTDARLRRSTIYPHGSIRLQTANRPLFENEFDVDLVCHLLGVGPEIAPATAKKLIGDRLRESSYYRPPMLEEKRRCWRINYCGEFHLDITPTIANPRCPSGGELVPDKSTGMWKPTHPRGYADLFDRRAAQTPTFHLQETHAMFKAEVQPLPEQRPLKGLLRRIVQLLKRDRDIFFQDNCDVAPISIVITTLASRAYEAALQYTYESELDVMVEVVTLMPRFIRLENTHTGTYYAIENETTQGENFADKWNQDARLAQAFYRWHENVVARLKHMVGEAGIDTLRKSLSEAYGNDVAGRVFERYTRRISEARGAGRLYVAPVVGVSAAATGVRAQSHTFYGE